MLLIFCSAEYFSAGDGQWELLFILKHISDESPRARRKRQGEEDRREHAVRIHYIANEAKHHAGCICIKIIKHMVELTERMN